MWNIKYFKPYVHVEKSENKSCWSSRFYFAKCQQIKQRKQPKQFIFSAIKTEYIHYKTEHPSSAPENRAKQHTLVPEKKTEYSATATFTKQSLVLKTGEASHTH